MLAIIRSLFVVVIGIIFIYIVRVIFIIVDSCFFWNMTESCGSSSKQPTQLV